MINVLFIFVNILIIFIERCFFNFFGRYWSKDIVKIYDFIVGFLCLFIGFCFITIGFWGVVVNRRVGFLFRNVIV